MVQELKNEFYQPNSEFSPCPFWFWNDRLSNQEITRQIQDFRAKGVMGFVIHPRIGIPKDIPYLSDCFMAFVLHAVAEAARYGMKVVLYDEGMYPSGSAHGMVVASNPRYATRGIRIIESDITDLPVKVPELAKGETVISILAVEKIAPDTVKPGSVQRLDLTAGNIYFIRPNCGEWAVLFLVETFSGGTIRGIHFGEDDGEADAPLSADLLNPDAVWEFIHLTHERYYSVLKDYFGSTIIAIFTDEPDLLGRNPGPGIKPWTTGFLEQYRQCGNSELDLAALWFDVGPETEKKRRNFRHAINQQLELSYYRQLSAWCDEHGIALTGHPQRSEDIGFLQYFQIPGQDLVWRWVAPENGLGLNGAHSTLGKCSSDAARHYGRRRNSNECFGCCGPNGVHWAFSMDDMKWYLDWLFLRGVNLIYPHAFYYSINGAKRINERPPDVGPHNIWWPYYDRIAAYIKRLSWLMTDSYNVTPIAVLCDAVHLPWAIVKPLYQNQIEFNYLEENLLLSEQCRITDGCINIEHQHYRIVLIENISLFAGRVRERLMGFINGGGQVIIYNPAPAENLPVSVHQIHSFNQIIQAIDKFTTKDIQVDPVNKDLRVSHVVKGDCHFYFLVNEGEEPIQGQIRIGTYGSVEKWDPWLGKTEKQTIQNWDRPTMLLPFRLERRESMIYTVDPAGIPDQKSAIKTEQTEIAVELELIEQWKLHGPFGETPLERSLTSWTEWAGLADFSGTIVYETVFQIADLKDIQRLQLDLGRVAEIAHLYINDIDAGVKLWAPYLFDITECVKAGVNLIKVAVTNSLANRISHAKLRSGLLGPVKIRLIRI